MRYVCSLKFFRVYYIINWFFNLTQDNGIFLVNINGLILLKHDVINFSTEILFEEILFLRYQVENGDRFDLKTLLK